MYEHFFEEFQYLTTDNPQWCAIQLLKPPFAGVKLYIGRKFTFTGVSEQENKGIDFDYDIFDHPADFTEDQVGEEFTNLVTGIFLAILEQKTGMVVIPTGGPDVGLGT